MNNNGGVYATRGFDYQDSAAVNAIFDYINDKDFKGIRIEGENDFEIVKTNEISSQVKSGIETLPKIGKEIISNLPDNKVEYLIYVSNLNNEAKNFVTNLEYFKDEKSRVDDQEIMKKLKISIDEVPKVRKCKFKIFPYGAVDDINTGRIGKWLTTHRVYNGDISKIYKKLLDLMHEGRKARKFYSKEDILRCIVSSKYLIDNSNMIDLINNLSGFRADIIEEINKIIAWNNGLFNTNQLETLKILISSRNKDALIQIDQNAEDNPKFNILKTAVHFLFGDFEENSISIQKNKEELTDFEKLTLALHYFKREDYKNARIFTQKIDSKNVKTDVNFLLGLILYNLRDYSEAISYFKKDTDTDSKRSLALCLIFMCYRETNPFYDNYTFLEVAQQLDSNNKLAEILEIEYFVDNERYEDALQLFNTFSLTNYTLEEKMRLYLSVIVAEQQLNDAQLHNDMISFINTYKKINPRRSASFIYVGLYYTEIFSIKFEKEYYVFVLGNNKVVVGDTDNKKIGLTVDATPVWKKVNMTMSSMTGEKISPQRFILKIGSPTLRMEVNPEELDKILHQTMIASNRLETKEYTTKATLGNKLTEKVKAKIFFNLSNVKGDVLIGDYSTSFIVSELGEGTYYFKKALKNASDFLIELDNCGELYYLTLPIECVHVVDN